MPEEQNQPRPLKTIDETASDIFWQLHAHVSGLLAEPDPLLLQNIQTTFDTAVDTVRQFAGLGLESARIATEILTEFAQDLTGVDSFRVIPKAPATLEVDIRCKKESDIEVRQNVAPFVELRSLHLGKQINFEALVDTSKRGLKLTIHKGMSLRFDIAGPLFSKMVVLEGSALLTRDEKGQLILETTTKIPNTETPITVRIPIKHIITGVQYLQGMQ